MSSSTASLPYTLKDDPFSSHVVITNLVTQYAPATPYTVLDVGCAYGFLRTYLPKPQFYLLGLEADATAVTHTRQIYDEVHQADISTQYEAAFTRSPQCIIFGDVLEHVPNSLNALQWTLAKYGRQGTRVIISLPNIAHLYARLSLLAGRFNYAERGLFDKTHLRFFTLQTARALLKASNLTIHQIRATPVPLPLLSPVFNEGQPLFALHRLSNWSANTFKTLLAYQLVFEATYEPTHAEH